MTIKLRILAKNLAPSKLLKHPDVSFPKKFDLNLQERQRLQDLVQRAHAEGKKVRLWAAPDTPQVWTFLLDNGVDLINTDKLPELRQFLIQRYKLPTNRN